MKNIFSILAISLILLMSSCVPELNFEEPQPENEKNQIKLKNRFLGTYLCLSDSSILTVDKNKIVQNWHTIFKVSKAELDTTDDIEIRNGMIYSPENEKALPVEFIGDTAVITWDAEKTIFKISDKQILRHFKGLYFLNFQESDDLWTVKTLQLKKDILTINKIYGGHAKIEKIKEMTKVKEITDEKGVVVDYKIKPSKKELKEILKSDLLKEGNKFQKIKKQAN